MKTAEKLAAGWLLTLGFMFLAISVSDILERLQQPKVKVYPEDSQEFVAPQANDYSTIAAGIAFAVPSLTVGGWLTLGLYSQSRQEKKALRQQSNENLQSLFYQMIQENQGRVTVLGFAMQSKLPPVEARKYLDEKAKEFNANFKVSDEGAVSYHFDV
ncbi:MAG TPA: hypothetical protein VK203_18180 [Nostocaceae cyanobacterium]|nr:hypothetical protein [Nostocaceae cyanobacterium]